MGKLPYIPLYIGDWEQDTNCISIEAEGALLKLIFKLWKSETKGLLTISFSQLAILLKKPQENALKIVQELKENDVLNIEFLPDNKIKIESRRMTKEAAKSKTYKENGSKGGRGKKANQKLTKSKSKAKHKLITEYEYEDESEDEIENKGLTVVSGFEKIDKVLELKNATVWQTDIAIKMKVPLTYVEEKLNYFLMRESLKDEFETQTLKQVKTYFINWLPKQIQSDVTNTTKRKDTVNDRKSSVRALGDAAREYYQKNTGSVG